MKTKRWKERLKVCFFALVPNRHFFDFVEFYATDIRILRELGFEVYLANRPWQIPLGCDLYFSWFHAPASAAQIVATLCRKPHVVVDNPQAALPKGLVPARNIKRLLWHFCERLNMRFSDLTLATSEYELSIYKQLRARNPMLVYHGVDTNLYSPSEKRWTRLSHQVITVTHLRFHNIIRKRLKEIIRSIPLVAAEFPAVEFVIAGGWDDASVLNDLQGLAERVGASSNLRFVGEISREEKIRLYRESAVYLQPTMHEGFGLAIAEAMSCGLPVVTSRVAAVPEVVGEEGLFAKDDPADIAAQVCRLLGDPCLREHLGKQGRERIVQFFSYEMRRDKMAAVLSKIINKKIE